MEHYKYKDQKFTISIDFTSHDFACFHDSIINACNKHLNQNELLEIWNLLPVNIQTTAMEWGMSDTEFGDEVYTWVKENLDKLSKYKTWED